MSLFTLLIVTIVLIITLVVLLLRTPRGHAGRHAAWVVAGALLWIVSINLPGYAVDSMTH
jgi:hypothetical protein